MSDTPGSSQNASTNLGDQAGLTAGSSLGDPRPDAAPQDQEVCQHARLPNDRVPEPAVAATDGFIDECLNTLAARKIRDAERYKALKRQTLASVESADDYGHIAETFDKECDELIEYFRKFDAGMLWICPNCDTALPRGCGGQFKQDGEACCWNRGK